MSTQEADVAAAPLYVTDQREDVVDFSIPFIDVQAAILLKKPPTGSTARIRFAGDLLKHPSMTYGTLNTGIDWEFGPHGFKIRKNSQILNFF